MTTIRNRLNIEFDKICMPSIQVLGISESKFSVLLWDSISDLLFDGIEQWANYSLNWMILILLERFM